MSKTKISEFPLTSGAEMICTPHILNINININIKCEKIVVTHLFIPFQLIHGGDDVGHLLQIDAPTVVHVIHPENIKY